MNCPLPYLRSSNTNLLVRPSDITGNFSSRSALFPHHLPRTLYRYRSDQLIKYQSLNGNKISSRTVHSLLCRLVTAHHIHFTIFGALQICPRVRMYINIQICLISINYVWSRTVCLFLQTEILRIKWMVVSNVIRHYYTCPQRYALFRVYWFTAKWPLFS